jgi:hypothetical protein
LKWNEDFVVYHDYNYALILDGATGLEKDILNKDELSQTDAIWFVRRFAYYVEQYIDSSIEVKELVKKCINKVKKDYEELVKEDRFKDPLYEPSASMALVKRTKEHMELLMMGDISLLLRNPMGEVSHIHDEAVSRLDDYVISELVKLSQNLNKNIIDVIKEDKIQALLKANRLKKNQKDGYCILGMDENAVVSGMYYNFEEAEFAEMLFCSDGFMAYYDKYHLCPEAEEMLKLVENHKMEWMMDKIRSVETKDKDCNEYPRFKQSDDATAILIASEAKKD